MSAIRLANTDPADIPTPPTDRTYLFLDLAGVPSLKDATGAVAQLVSSPLVGVTIAALPTPATAGMVALVTDANPNSWGGVVQSGGDVNTLVFFDGFDWIVFGQAQTL